MAKCKNCDRSGFFFSVDSNGLCNECAPVIMSIANHNLRVINESTKIINKSKNFKTQLSRCDLIIEIAEVMLKYENKGITTIIPSPSEMISQYKNVVRDRIILENLKLDVEKGKAKFEIASTPQSKINEINKVLFKIQDYEKEIKDKTQINKTEKEINKFKHKAQLSIYLETAKKAEFKGQNKKALDQYQEALYFLKNDEIDDKFQKDNINKIENKIKDLDNYRKDKK